MTNYLDYKTCPKCYAVVGKGEYKAHLEKCSPEILSSHPVDIAQAKAKKEKEATLKKVKEDTKYKGKDISEMREIAKSLGITTGTKGVKKLIEEVLIKESEVNNG